MGPGPKRAERLGDAIRRITADLTAAGIEDARAEARLLVGAATGLDRTALFSRPEALLDVDAAAKLADLKARRCRREPMAHLLGEREFWSLSFRVDGSTLIPRPESECLIEAALAHSTAKRPTRVLDLGTGSGCLLLSFLSERPEAFGIGLDLSEEAIRAARSNAERLGLQARAAFVRSDWSAALRPGFDVILANPPYVSLDELAELEPEVREFEPHMALTAGQDTLGAYRHLAPEVARLLNPGGVAVLEIGWTQAQVVSDLLIQAGLSVKAPIRDLAGRDRALVASY